MIDLVSLAGIAGAPLVVALVQLVRVSWPALPTRYLPAVTLGVAIVLNVGLATQTGTSVGLACLVGVVTGLSASGLYAHATAALRPSERVGETANGRTGETANGRDGETAKFVPSLPRPFAPSPTRPLADSPAHPPADSPARPVADTEGKGV